MKEEGHKLLSIGSVYSVLSADELLEKVVSNYPLGNVRNCILWERGFNDTYKIETECNDYILRVYRCDRRTLEDIEFEVGVLLHLESRNVSVSFPLGRIDGEYITAVSTAEGVRYAIVTRYAEGAPFTYGSLSEAFLYGEHVAMVHVATDGFESKYDRKILDGKYLIEDPVHSILRLPGIRLEYKEYIEVLGRKLSVHLEEMSRNNLDYGFCHGDFHGWNAHHTGDDVEFFDFDFCGFGLRAYDLATFRWAARLRDKETERWEEFVRGYRSKRAIESVDLDLTAVFMAIRDIWLIGQHIGSTAVSGRNWINNDYFEKRIKFLQKLEIEIFTGS